MNKIGPNTLPCGTPLLMGKYEDKTLTQTHCFLLQMKYCNKTFFKTIIYSKILSSFYNAVKL